MSFNVIEINVNEDIDNYLNEQLSKTFAKNMQSFKSLIPYIYEQFENYETKRDLSIIITENKDLDVQFADGSFIYGVPNVQEKVAKDLEKFFNEGSLEVTRYAYQKDYFGQIHYRYLNEVKDILDTKVKIHEKSKIKDIETIPMLFHIGVGLGYSFPLLYQNKDIRNIFIMEPDEDVFFASLHTFDWSSLLEYVLANKIYLNFVIGGSKDKLLSDIDFYFKNHGKFLGGASALYSHYESVGTNAYVNTLKNDFASINMALGFIDDHIFATSHSINVLLDKKRLAYDKYNVPKDIQDVPVFIIGNGPSLDNDLDFLRKNQDKALIVACGTSIDTLYQNGIKPDIFASTERVRQMADILNAVNKNNFLDDILLLSTDVVHPNVTKLFKRTAIFSKIDEPFAWVFEDFYDKYPDLKLFKKVRLTNPLVSNLAISSLLEFGFTNLILFGIDCGTKSRDKLHATSSTLYNSLGLESSGTNYQLNGVIDGNFDGYVSSNDIYKLSINMINSIVDLYKVSYKERNYTIRNCSDGAKIDVATPCRSYDLGFDSKDNLNKDYINEIIDTKLTYVVDFTRDDVDVIINKDTYNKIVDFVIAKLSLNFDDRISFVANLQDIAQDVSVLAYSEQRFYGLTLQGSINTFLFTVVDALFSIKDKDIAIAVAKEIIERIVYLLEDSKKIFAYIPDYLMSNHNELLDNKVGFDHEKSKAQETPYNYVAINNKENLENIKEFKKRYN